MKAPKAIVPRTLVNRDVEEAIDHYLGVASAKAALAFVDDLPKAYAQIALNPTIGSPRYAYQLGLPELRFLPLKRYPYLVFYVERDDCVDVWRVLHQQRDIPSWMNEI